MYFFLNLLCKTIITYKNLPVSIIRNISTNTPLLIETKIYSRRGRKDEWEENNNSNIKMQVFPSETNAINDLGKIYRRFTHNNVEYEKEGSGQNFYFTANKKNYYEFRFSLSNLDRDYEYGIHIASYMGTENSPQIVSYADTIFQQFNRQIQNAIDLCTEIYKVYQDEQYSSAMLSQTVKVIIRIIALTFLLKMIVVIVGFVLANRESKNVFMKAMRKGR